MKLHGTQAAGGIPRGAAWSVVAVDNREFALSALHVARLHPARTRGKVLVRVPGPLAGATAVALFDRALTSSSVPLDIIAVEFDAKTLQGASFGCACKLELPCPTADQWPVDTPVVGWSEQMPLSGTLLGLKGATVHFSTVDGCVPGNSGALMFPVTGAGVGQPLGVYYGIAGTDTKRGLLAPLPSAIPTTASPILRVSKATKAEPRGTFQLVSATRVTRTVTLAKGRELSESECDACQGTGVSVPPGGDFAYLEFAVTDELDDAFRAHVASQHKRTLAGAMLGCLLERVIKFSGLGHASSS